MAQESASRLLSEHDSKQLLAGFGLPLARERLVEGADAAMVAAAELGFPVVLKLCGEHIAHKTERDLVRLGLASRDAVRDAAEDLLARARPEDGLQGLLVAEQVSGKRELIAGLVRDREFGPCVSFGLGGILTEALGDVVFAMAPLSREGARRLIRGLRTSHLLLRPFRGDPPADEERLIELLMGLGRLGVERPDVASVDVNPLLLRGAEPVAVDALVELSEPAGIPVASVRPVPAARLLERFQPLFHPRTIVVSGVSSHPGKFGFAAFHNLLRWGYKGEIVPLSRDGGEVLGRPTYRDLAEAPGTRADLLFLCTPPAMNLELLRAASARGVRAAFVASGGYGEAGAEGRERERELVALSDELGVLLAGPNGQGVISTAESMCAQIVAPYPPPGRISVASQSGNLVSSFLNYAVQTGVGVAHAISAGNAAQ
ncbi:MAG: acetate--CoA ligase family protein, partial [Myxococcota bacterium]